MSLKVIVASTNPVKIEATKTAFEQVFQLPISIQGIKVDSGVKDQPLSQSETAEGAQQRVLNAKMLYPNAHFWVGIEGGVHPMNDSFEAFGWIFVSHHSGQTSSSRSAGFKLPSKVAQELRKGRELGPVNDKVFGQKNSKHQSGAVGLLTNDLITRTQLYQQAIILALIPFLKEDLYPFPA